MFYSLKKFKIFSFLRLLVIYVQGFKFLTLLTLKWCQATPHNNINLFCNFDTIFYPKWAWPGRGQNLESHNLENAVHNLLELIADSS